ncbi:MAG: hypothetical protein LUF92_14610 [Clostridiales bacterium]|nr:hypothetical protein [Clostridiales bacterium]
MKEQKDRLKKALEKYGLTVDDDADITDAVKDIQEIDLGIFVKKVDA